MLQVPYDGTRCMNNCSLRLSCVKATSASLPPQLEPARSCTLVFLTGHEGRCGASHFGHGMCKARCQEFFLHRFASLAFYVADSSACRAQGKTCLFRLENQVRMSPSSSASQCKVEPDTAFGCNLPPMHYAKMLPQPCSVSKEPLQHSR